MTAVPRVRVERSRYVFPGRWRWRCGECASVSLWYYPVPDGRVQTAAADHARTCPALRLARLVAELETLREHWADESRRWIDSATESDRPSDLTRGFRIGAGCGISYVVGDLDRLIKETNR